MIGESFVRPSHQHTGRESVQLDGLAAEQEEIEHIGGECDNTAVPQIQYGDLALPIIVVCFFLVIRYHYGICYV